MSPKIQKILKSLFLFLVGGTLYFALEMVTRGRSHWTMFLLGGLCFFLIGEINELIPWEMPLIFQGLIGSAIVTSLEFVTGCTVNLWLQWDIWDYSNLPFNLLGQICLPFSLLWIFVSLVAVILDDWLRYRFFGEEKPHYTLILRR